MKVRKITAIVLSAVLAGSLSACGYSAAASEKMKAAEKVKTSTAEVSAEESMAGNMTGGWEANQGKTSPDDNKEVKKAFEKAIAGLDGCTYEAIAYLGSQTVTGTNYFILCRLTPVAPNAESSFALVTVYEDLKGNAEITDTQDVVPGASETNAESQTDSSSAEDSSAAEDTGSASAVGEQVADPFSEAATLKDAAAVTGFPLTVPDAPKNYPDTVIRVMDKEMIEVIYEKGTDEGYRIRKAAGSDEITGDYNTYENIKTAAVGSYTVTLKGNGGTYSAASWTYGGYAYAMDAEDHPLSLEAMTAVISAVR